MAPSHWLTILLTPERWTFLPDGLASWITRHIAVDTTRAGRAIRRGNPFTRFRNGVLPHSSALRSLDWQVRKLFWTALWCVMVVFQG